MLVGMGVVFSFLVVLVMGIQLMAWCVSLFPAQADPVTPTPTLPQAPAVDATTLRVIEDAIRQHRARRGPR